VILAWFVILTRQEASVIRASMMAAVGATVFAAGRQATGGQILGLAATVTLLVDPFLAWSVGWWLSMTGAGGLIFLTPVILRAISRFNPTSDVPANGLRSGNVEKSNGWISKWIGPMLAAQIGVLPVSVLVFGVPSAWAIPCNLLAVPVAGVVMLIGLPTALISGFLPMPLAQVMMWPLGAGVRWVDTVAALGARLRLPTLINQFVAGALVSLMMAAMWYHWRQRHVTT
jgi:competence protein ComEC